MSFIYQKPLIFPAYVPLLLITLYSCGFLITVVIIKFYLSQRSNIFINARSPIIMTLTILSSWFASLLQMLPALTNVQFYCIPSNLPVLWLNQTIPILGFTFPTWRCVLLIIHNHKQKLLKSGIPGNQRQYNIILSITAILLMIISLTPMLSEILGVSVVPSSHSSSYALEYCQILDSVGIGICCSMALVWCILALFIRNIEETMNITRELKHCAYVVFFHYIVYTSVSSSYRGLTGSLCSLIYFILISSLLTYLACFRPLQEIKTLGFQRINNHNKIVPLNSRVTAYSPDVFLGHILANQQLKTGLLDHLSKELSLENLSFILDLDNFRNCDRDDYHTEARRIYDQYISRSAFNEINLPGHIALPIHEFFRASTVTSTQREYVEVYDQAYLEITRLIENDSLPRFMKTAVYINLSQSIG